MGNAGGRKRGSSSLMMAVIGGIPEPAAATSVMSLGANWVQVGDAAKKVLDRIFPLTRFENQHKKGPSNESDHPVKTIRLEMICTACPEAYEAYCGDEKVGYLRLRYGHFYAVCPDINGEKVYEHFIDDDPYAGIFTDDEREVHLTKAREAIADWMEKVKAGEGKTFS